MKQSNDSNPNTNTELGFESKNKPVTVAAITAAAIFCVFVIISSLSESNSPSNNSAKAAKAFVKPANAAVSANANENNSTSNNSAKAAKAFVKTANAAVSANANEANSTSNNSAKAAKTFVKPANAAVSIDTNAIEIIKSKLKSSEYRLAIMLLKNNFQNKLTAWAPIEQVEKAILQELESENVSNDAKIELLDSWLGFLNNKICYINAQDIEALSKSLSKAEKLSLDLMPEIGKEEVVQEDLSNSLSPNERLKIEKMLKNKPTEKSMSELLNAINEKELDEQLQNEVNAYIEKGSIVLQAKRAYDGIQEIINIYNNTDEQFLLASLQNRLLSYGDICAEALKKGVKITSYTTVENDINSAIKARNERYYEREIEPEIEKLNQLLNEFNFTSTNTLLAKIDSQKDKIEKLFMNFHLCPTVHDRPLEFKKIYQDIIYEAFKEKTTSAYASLKSCIEFCSSEIDAFLERIEDKNIKRQISEEAQQKRDDLLAKAHKKYNLKVLKRIKAAYDQRDKWKGKDRMGFIKTHFAKIDVRLLNADVVRVYSEVYTELQNELDTKQKLELADFIEGSEKWSLENVP